MILTLRFKIQTQPKSTTKVAKRIEQRTKRPRVRDRIPVLREIQIADLNASPAAVDAAAEVADEVKVQLAAES